MSRSLAQLLTLRRTREQQAQAQLQAVMTRHRDQEEELARLEIQEKDTVAAVARRIAELYRHCENQRLSRGDLDMLTARVDGQYRIEADMHAAVAEAGRLLATIAEEVETARQQVIERGRNVQKLDLILDTLRAESERTAEAMAEDEAERPPAAALP